MHKRPNDTPGGDSPIAITSVLRPSSFTRSDNFSATSLRPLAVVSLCSAIRPTWQPASRTAFDPVKSKPYPLSMIRRVASRPPAKTVRRTHLLCEAMFANGLLRSMFAQHVARRAPLDHLFAPCPMLTDLCLRVDRAPEANSHLHISGAISPRIPNLCTIASSPNRMHFSLVGCGALVPEVGAIAVGCPPPGTPGIAQHRRHMDAGLSAPPLAPFGVGLRPPCFGFFSPSPSPPPR